MLNFQFTDNEKFNSLTVDEKKLNDTFIWGCMFVGLANITEKNAKEWQWRYEYSVKLNGPSFTIDGKPYIPTIEDVKKRIGLTTNCFPDKSRNQFVQSQARIYNHSNS